jgi:hypothetical protein
MTDFKADYLGNLTQSALINFALFVNGWPFFLFQNLVNTLENSVKQCFG